MQTLVFSGTLKNGLDVCVWWIIDDARYLIEVVDPNNIYSRVLDEEMKDAKGVLSYLSEIQQYKQKD